MEIEMIESESTQIAEYNPVAAGLAELRRKYGNVAVDVSTPKALEEAKRVRAEIREPRYETERIRKVLKKPALDHAKLIDTEAARITAALLEIETPWDDAIKAEEARREQERQKREAGERARISAIHELIAEIRGFVALAMQCRTSDRIAQLLEKLAARRAMGWGMYQEFAAEAEKVHVATVQTITQIHQEKIDEEIERARVKAEQDALAAELAKARAEQAAAAQQLAIERAALEKEKAEVTKVLAEQSDRLKAERESALHATSDDFEANLQAFAAAVEPEKVPEPAPATVNPAPVRAPTRPTDMEIVNVLAQHYRVHESVVTVWLLSMDIDAVEEAISAEFL